MALAAYIANTQLLLSNPAAPTTLYSSQNITTFINTARTQLAGESECCRVTGSLAITSATAIYNFTSIGGLPAGAQGVFNVRQATINQGTGRVYLGSRPYPWAVNYWLNNPSPPQAQPTEWSQYGIGQTGSMLFNPFPDTSYTVNVDVVAVPIVLASDTDPEIIPYAYTDCIPYFAAFYAYMSAQRQSDAEQMYQRYEEFLMRARKIAVPNVLSNQYDQMEMPATPPQGQAGGGGG